MKKKWNNKLGISKKEHGEETPRNKQIKNTYRRKARKINTKKAWSVFRRIMRSINKG